MIVDLRIFGIVVLVLQYNSLVIAITKDLLGSNLDLFPLVVGEILGLWEVVRVAHDVLLEV
jgi:hypothetical protein